MKNKKQKNYLMLHPTELIKKNLKEREEKDFKSINISRKLIKDENFTENAITD
jgi:hypothetical protein